MPNSRTLALLHLLRQPHPRELPIAVDGRAPDAERRGDLVVRQSPQDAQLDDLGLARVDAFEAFEGIEQGERAIARRTFDVVTGYDLEIERRTLQLPAAFRCVPAAMVITQHADHERRRDVEEVRATVEAFALLDQAQIGLVDERRRLQRALRIASPVTQHLHSCQPVQIFVHHAHELLPSDVVALVDTVQEARHLGGIEGAGTHGFLESMGRAIVFVGRGAVKRGKPSREERPS